MVHSFEKYHIPSNNIFNYNEIIETIIVRYNIHFSQNLILAVIEMSIKNKYGGYVLSA